MAFTIFYYYYDFICTVLTFVDINECSEMAPCSQGCENMNGSYKCYCLQGYRLGTGNTCLGKLVFYHTDFLNAIKNVTAMQDATQKMREFEQCMQTKCI